MKIFARNKKIHSVGSLVKRLNQHRKEKRKIVFTNGCFDVLHCGHVDFLNFCKSKGGIVVVGINSDSSVKKIKGPERPINSERDRSLVLSGLESVDYISIFEELDPLNIIMKVKPDILIKGQGGGNGAGTNNYGIILTGSSGAVVTASGSASITLDGRGKGGAAGVNSNRINGSLAGGNVTLFADTDSGTDSIILTGPISGTGNLYLQPRTAATTVGIAGGAGTFNLSSAELDTIQSGFAGITIGRPDGTGLIAVGNGAGPGYTFNANTVIQNPGSGSGGIPPGKGLLGLTCQDTHCSFGRGAPKVLVVLLS